MTSVQNFKSMLRGGSILPFLLICTAGLLVYSNTLHGPFLLDEEKYLRDNPFVKSVEGSLGPMEPGCELYKSIVQRYIGYLTFALNYRVHGLRVEGYHVVNATVHILNGVLVYLVALLTFRTPRLTRSALSGHARTVALFSGLLFVVHPVQTEAVTYIMQRLASLVAFFSLLSLVLYIMWRLPRIAGEGSGGQGQSGLQDHGSLWWYAGSILSAVLAMKTKENAFTLPAAIMAFELFFFSGDVRKRIVRLLPLMATMLIIPASTLFLMIGKGMQLAQMAAGGGDSVTLPWRTYLITQSRVVVTYVRLLLLPVDQNFLYEYPVYASLLHPEIFLSVAFHLFMAFAGIFLFRRSKSAVPELRVISYGIAWFYITLFVESCLIPLPLILCEYRLYLPSVGFIIAFVTAVLWLLTKGGWRRGPLIGMIALAVVVLANASAAYRRNALLSNAVALWEDTVRKSPTSSKAHANLGTHYIRGGRQHEAVEEFRTALDLDPEARIARHNIIVAYIRQGQFAQATEEFQKSLGPGVNAAQAHKHLGDLYMEEGAMRAGVAEYEMVRRLDPENAEVRYELGNAYAQLGNFHGALSEYQAAIRLRPDHLDARNNLSGVYVQLGRYEDALRELQAILERAPAHEDARYNLQIVTEVLAQKPARAR